MNNSGQYLKNIPQVNPNITDLVIVIQNGFAKAASIQDIAAKENASLVEMVNLKASTIYVDDKLSLRYLKTEVFNKDEINQIKDLLNISIDSTNSNLTNEVSRATNAESTITNTINTNKPVWDDKYTKSETFNKEEILQKINDLINGAPQTLDTINEIAAALGNDPNFSTTIINLLGNKVDKDGTKVLSDNNYSDVDEAKVGTLVTTGDGKMFHANDGQYYVETFVKPSNYIYVAKNGNDTTGDGSANTPYLTIQKAIDIANGGTTIFAFPGSYSENITFKANVYLTASVKYGVYITGNHTANFTGTAILENIVLNSTSGITLSFTGTNTQSLQLLGCSVDSNSGHAISWTNTNTSSKIYSEDSISNVSTSGSTAKNLYCPSTAKGTFIANRFSFKVNNPDNVSLDVGGALNFIHTADQIIGQVVVSNSASVSIGNMVMTTNSVPVLITNSTGMTTIASTIVNTTSNPIISGSGLFTYVAILYANTGVGGASTLNSGSGPIALKMSSIKLRDTGLLPSQQILAGLNDGAFEFSGQELYFSKNSARYKVAMGDVYKIVDVLPTTNILPDYLYLLTTDGSINVHNGTDWKTYGGTGSGTGLTTEQEAKLNAIDITGSSSEVLTRNGTYTDNISAKKINGHTVDNSTYAPNRAIIVDSNGNYTHGDINVAGLVGSTGDIIVPSGSPTSIAAGQEVIFNHPLVADDKIMINIQQQITGATVSDTHVDFNDSSKYVLQDIGKILIGNNKAELDIYTKFLMHADDSSFTDVCGHIVTNNNVTFNSTIKKFGTGSAYFNGTNANLNTPISTDFQFGSGDFTLSWWEYMTSSTSNASSLIFQSNVSDSSFSALIFGVNNTYKSVYLTSNGTSWDIANNVRMGSIITNSWVHYAVCRKGTSIYLFQNGTLQNTITSSSALYYNSGWKLFFGARASIYYSGYFDEVHISKGKALWTSDFLVPTSPQAGITYLTVNLPTNFKTTGNSNFTLTTLVMLVSISCTVTLPVGTSAKWLFSVDNGVNWLYKDGTGIHIYSGDLTIDWTSSNQFSELQTYFTNLEITQLTTDLSGLSITPVSLDFAWQLNTTDLTVTPSVGKITLVYQEADHTELASFGGYNETGIMFGTKRIRSTIDPTKSSALAVKNLTASAKVANVNIITGV